MRKKLLLALMCSLVSLKSAYCQSEQDVWVSIVTFSKASFHDPTPTTLHMTAPNWITLGNAHPNGTSGNIKALFVTSDDKLYVDARIEHPHRGKHIIKLSNGGAFVKTYDFYGGMCTIQEEVPLSHLYGHIEKLLFEVTLYDN